MDAWQRGIVEVLNETYIVCRHTPPGDAARRALYRYFYGLRLPHLLAMSYDAYQRRRLGAFMAALRAVGDLVSATPDRLDAVYVSHRDRLIARGAVQQP